MMHACIYSAYIYDAANFVTDEPTDKAILGLGRKGDFLDLFVWHNFCQKSD